MLGPMSWRVRIAILALAALVWAIWSLTREKSAESTRTLLDTIPALEAPLEVSAPAAAPAPKSEGAKPKSLSPAEIQAARSEMKVALAANYGGQKSFFSEYNRYSTDFRMIGYVPEPGALLYAKFGYLSPFVPSNPLENEDHRFIDSDAFVNEEEAVPEGRPVYRPSAEAITLGNYSGFCRQGCTAGDDFFELMVAAQLIEGYPADVWVINEKKELRHVQDGTRPDGQPPAEPDQR